MVFEITFIITLIYYKDRMSLVTLRTRKVLKTLTLLKALTAEPPSGPNITISIKLKITMAQSKVFIRSEKYSPKPIPIYFRIMSIVKIIVNQRLTLFKNISPSSSTSPSAARTIVFRKTHNIIKLSKIAEMAKSRMYLRIIEIKPKIPEM